MENEYESAATRQGCAAGALRGVVNCLSIGELLEKPESKLLKGVIQGTLTRAIKGDTRSLDNGSYGQ